MKSVKGFTPVGEFGILMLFLGVGFFLAAIVQLGIGMTMVPDGTSLDKMGDVMIKAMLKPENVTMARLSQVLGTFLLLCVPVFLYLWVTWGKNTWWLGFNKYVNARQVAIGFAIIFAAGVLASPLADLSKFIVGHFPSLDAMAQKLEDAYTEQVMALSNLKSWPEFFMAIVVMAFFPALLEEMFFRGALQNILMRWWKNPVIVITVTSLIFSLIHFSIYLFISRAILGFVLGWMYYQTRNIWVNIIAHFLNNLIAVITLFYMGMKYEKPDLTKLEPTLHWGWAILALGVLVFLFRLLEKYSAENRTIIQTKENLILQSNDPFGGIAHHQIQ